MRSRLPPGIEAIQAELAAHQFADLNEVQALLERRMTEYNAAPQAELGGLSPGEMHHLLAGDWETHGPLRLNDALDARDVPRAPIVMAAARLLEMAAVRGGVPATSAGNLTRRTVAQLMDDVSWPDGMVAEVRRYNKVVNEQDFQPVHVLRVVLDVAGLLRRRGKAFHATPVARTLLAGPAGGVAVRVFRTFYREFNLAYQGGMDETEPRQALVPFILLRIAALERAWRPLHELAPLLHPEFTFEAEAARRATEWRRFGGAADDPYFLRTVRVYAFTDLAHLILQPLVRFGLLDARERPSAERLLPYQDFRKTALFERFVTFPAGLIAATRRWRP